MHAVADAARRWAALGGSAHAEAVAAGRRFEAAATPDRGTGGISGRHSGVAGHLPGAVTATARAGAAVSHRACPVPAWEGGGGGDGGPAAAHDPPACRWEPDGGWSVRRDASWTPPSPTSPGSPGWTAAAAAAAGFGGDGDHDSDDIGSTPTADPDSDFGFDRAADADSEAGADSEA